MVGYKTSTTSREKYPTGYISKNSVTSLYTNHKVCRKFAKPFNDRKIQKNRLQSAELYKRGGRGSTMINTKRAGGENQSNTQLNSQSMTGDLQNPSVERMSKKTRTTGHTGTDTTKNMNSVLNFNKKIAREGGYLNPQSAL